MVLIAFYVQTNHHNIIITLLFMICGLMRQWKNNQSVDGIYSKPAKLPSSFFTIGVFKIGFLGFHHLIVFCFSSSSQSTAMTLSFIVMSGEWNFFLFFFFCEFLLAIDHPRGITSDSILIE